MAQKISEIQNQIADNLRKNVENLSSSDTAEWRLLTYVVAAAIQNFEIAHDVFKNEIDTLTAKITSGTVPWYVEMCKRFQWKDKNGKEYKLEYDPETAKLYYPVEDLEARIVDVVAVAEDKQQNHLRIKVAKINQDGIIVELEEELPAFIDYVHAISMAGIKCDVVSFSPDTIRYEAEVYYDPIYPRETVRKNVQDALDQFKTSLSYDAMFYTQRMVDAMMHAEGVVTVNLGKVEQNSYIKQNEPFEIVVMAELDAGYFDYHPDSVLEMKSVKEM